MYIDFVPEKIESKSGYVNGPYFERFSTLLDRANEWLKYRRNVQVLSVETISIRAKEPGTNHFLPAAAASMEYFFSSKTYHEERELKALRIWYVRHDGEELHNHQVGMAAIVPEQVHCKPWSTKPHFEPVSKTVHRINQQLKKNALPGRILCVESVPIRCISTFPPDLNETYYLPSEFALYVTKIWYLRGPEVHETIGFKDFVPEQIESRDTRAAYERLHETFRRASRWVRLKENVRITNLRTVDVKLRKRDPRVDPERPAQWVKLRSRLVTTIRVWYAEVNRLLPEPLPVITALSYRTFEPALVAIGGTDIKKNFETIPELVGRIGRWLVETGVKIVSVETIRIHIEKYKAVRDVEDTIRPVCLNSKTVLRFYFDGEFREPDPRKLPALPGIRVLGDGQVCSVL